MSNDLQQAIIALKSGQRDRARQLLLQLLKEEPHHDAAWVWLSRAVNTPEWQRVCLDRALAINPNNPQAHEALLDLIAAESDAEFPGSESPPVTPSVPSPTGPLPGGANLKEFLQSLHKNLNLLKEREAKYATAAPLDLLNLIDDYQSAIALTEHALELDMPIADLQAEFSSLNLQISTVVFVGEEKPRHPFTGANPYRGLRKFTEQDAKFFFGRNAAIQSLLGMVQYLTESETSIQMPDLIAVLGPSGSGKSSLVRAGLIPALWDGRIEGSHQWPIKVMLPGEHPLDALALTFAGEVGRAVASIRDTLAGGEKALHDLMVESLAVANKPDEAIFALVIDQFEELFTLCEDEAERRAFIEQVLYAAQTRRNRCLIVLTMRSDFYSKVAAYKPLAEAVTRQQMLVSPLTEKELREAILLPAETVGLELEKELVERLLADTADAPGVLPLLQHALLELFHRRDGNLLTLAAYNEIGGVQGALAHRANSVVNELTPDQQQTVRRIFMRLIQPSEGTMDTRRRAALTEVLTAGSETESVEALVQTLANANLLTTSFNPDTNQTVLDVSHEALIQEWPLLRHWLDEDREGLRIRQQLSQAARDWQERERDEDSLYRGAKLLEVEEWAGANLDEMNNLEQAFVTASVALRDREAREKEAQRQRELETARKLAKEAEARHQAEAQRADEQSRASKQLRRLVFSLIGILIIALVATFFAYRQSTISQARKLVSDSRLAFNQGKFHLAMLLALEANRLNETEELEIIKQIPYQVEYVTGFAVQNQKLDGGDFFAWQPDGYILASSTGREIAIWDTRSKTKIKQFDRPSTATDIIGLEWKPDGHLLAAKLADGSIEVWDVQQDKIQSLYRLEQGLSFLDEQDYFFSDITKAMAWHPNQPMLASTTGTDYGDVIIWNTQTGTVSDYLKGASNSISIGNGAEAIAWHPNDHYLAVGLIDWRIFIWDTKTREITNILEWHTGSIYSLAWHPDGRYLASGGYDRRILIWDMETEAIIATLEGHSGAIKNLTWHPNGQYLASGSDDGQIIIWEMETGKIVKTFQGHSSAVTSLIWQADGNHLVSSSEDNQIVISNVTSSPKSMTFEGHSAGVNDIEWHPDGNRLASAGTDKKVIIWDVTSGKIIKTLEGHTDWVDGISWHSNGLHLASVGSDNRVIIWNAETGQIVTTFGGEGSCITWQPGGNYLAYSVEGTIKIWDMATDSTVTTLNNAECLIWHPNGRFAAVLLNKGLKIWNLETKEFLETVTEENRRARWNPDGRYLAIVSNDEIIIRDTETKQQIATLDIHEIPTTDVAWHPNSQYLASWAVQQNKEITIWDIQTETRIATLEGHSDNITDVAWHPDGRYLASSGTDFKIRLLPKELTLGPCQWLISNLSIREWETFRGLALYNPTCSNLPSPKIPFPSVDWFYLTRAGRFSLFALGGIVLGFITAILWAGFALIKTVIKNW